MKYTVIEKDELQELLRSNTKEEIINIIFKRIRDNNYPLPIFRPEYEEVTIGFKKLLETDYENLLQKGSVFSRYEYSIPFSQEYIDINYDGLRTSGYYNYSERMKCDSVNAPSPVRTWENDKFLKTLLNSVFTLKPEVIDSSFLASAISLRKYIASQFRPSAAKFLYNHYKAKNVLDFSAGWGDRLIGFLASNAESYIGIDPNYKMCRKLVMIKQNPELNLGKKINIINRCAEDSQENLQDKSFDFIFTSPPYYNAERYTQDENQSWKRYKKLDEWLNNFLFASIKIAWNSLEQNGHMVINISDVYSGHKINHIVEPMHDYILSLSGCEFQKMIGYKLNKRLNSKADKDGIFVEPVLIYKKK